MASRAAKLALRSVVRVAEVCPYDLAVPGGVQAQVHGLAGELNRRGHHVDVIGPGASGWEWIKPIVPVPSNDAVARVALGPHVTWRLPSLLSTYDVVHVHEPLMPLVSTAAARADVPVVGTFHADPSPPVRRLLRWGYGRSVLRRLAATTAVSPTARSALPDQDIDVIPNAVEDRLFEPSPKVDRSVLFIGRDEPRKGLSVLVEAWDSVRSRVPEARLTVISNRRSGPGHIEWLGRVDDARRTRELRRASVLCAPNRRGESFGMVVAEGLAAGCSVVASDLPAFHWVAGDKADYVAIDTPQQLADRIVHRLSSPRPVDEQRRWARRFRWDVVGDEYEAVLAGVRRSA